MTGRTHLGRRARGRGDAPPDALAAWAAGVVGEFVSPRPRQGAHGTASVWRLDAAAGPFALKHHRHGRPHAQEVRAYRERLPGLPAAFAHATARPVAWRDETPRGLLLAWLSGEDADARARTAAEEAGLLREAGRFLAALHALPHADADPLPVGDAVARRWRSAAPGARALLGAREADRIGGRLDEVLPALAGARRAVCHRDFTRGNWRVGAGGAFAALDFEHCRADLSLLDLERVWSAELWGRPDLEAAFFAGYGRPLGGDEREALRRLAAVQAALTVTWAHRRGDAAFERLGRERLARLRAEGGSR